MVAASPSVVDRAPGLWVYEHLVALGIDGEARSSASSDPPSDRVRSVERSARLRARIALHSVTDAIAKAPDTLEIDVSHARALRILRQIAVEHMGVDAAGLEDGARWTVLEPSVSSGDWNAYKKALDALFPPDVRALSEKGKSPGKSPGVSRGTSGRPRTARARRRSAGAAPGCREPPPGAAPEVVVMTLREMRDAARGAVATRGTWARTP